MPIAQPCRCHQIPRQLFISGVGEAGMSMSSMGLISGLPMPSMGIFLPSG